MKKNYEAPVMEVVRWTESDVITTSGVVPRADVASFGTISATTSVSLNKFKGTEQNQIINLFEGLH